ncbi:MAG: DoxX family protein [Bacteroidetes bacterium]|nr:DoxX family protein [Bacteroidota bacterium]
MSEKISQTKTDLGLFILRLGTGISFIFIHGWNKIFGGPEIWSRIGGAMASFGIDFMPAFWGFMAAVSEFGGGIMLLLGLFTRTTSSFMAFTMIVAFSKHILNHDPWSKVFYPLEMLTIFLALIIMGAGKYSLDALISRKK